jgi:hypothetical protein
VSGLPLHSLQLDELPKIEIMDGVCYLRTLKALRTRGIRKGKPYENPTEQMKHDSICSQFMSKNRRLKIYRRLSFC